MNLVGELRRRRYSANARSLYLELAFELEGGGWVELSNVYLQERSGIRSSRSFDAARRELMEAGLIEYENRRYRVGDNAAEREWKANGNGMESEWKGNGKVSGISITKNSKSKNKKKETTTTTTTTARDSAIAAAAIQADDATEIPDIDNKPEKQESDVSNAVKAAWRRWNGTPLNMGITLELIAMEREYGVEGLVELINRAGRGDKFGTLTIRYLKSLKPEKKKEAAVKVQSAGKYGEEDIL